MDRKHSSTEVTDTNQTAELKSLYLVRQGKKSTASNSQQQNRLLIKDYPDVLDIEQMSLILSVSTKTCYGLLHAGAVSYLKVGRSYRIPKVNLLQYLNSAKSKLSDTEDS